MDIVANSHVLATKKPDRFGSSLMLLIICCWFCVFFWDSEVFVNNSSHTVKIYYDMGIENERNDV